MVIPLLANQDLTPMLVYPGLSTLPFILRNVYVNDIENISCRAEIFADGASLFKSISGKLIHSQEILGLKGSIAIDDG